MNKKLLALLACPICKGALVLNHQELTCTVDKLAFPIQDGIPVLLESEARLLVTNDEK